MKALTRGYRKVE